MFAGRMVAQGTHLPDYVQRGFEDYLKCGRLEPDGLRPNLTPNGVLGRKTAYPIWLLIAHNGHR